MLPQICVGTLGLDAPAIAKMIAHAFVHMKRVGVDCAAAYGNLDEVGKAISKFDADNISLVLKLPGFLLDGTEAGFKTTYDKAIASLGREPAVLMLHGPDCLSATNIAMLKCTAPCFFGLSNVNAEELEALWKVADFVPNVVQNEMNLRHWDKSAFEWCVAHDVQYQGYRPMKGDVTSQSTMPWMRQKGVCPVFTSTDHEHIASNFERFYGKEMSKEEVERFDSYNEHPDGSSCNWVTKIDVEKRAAGAKWLEL